MSQDASGDCHRCPPRTGSYWGRTGPDCRCFRDFPVLGMQFESHLPELATLLTFPLVDGVAKTMKVNAWMALDKLPAAVDRAATRASDGLATVLRAAPKSGGSTKPGLPGRRVRIPHTCTLSTYRTPAYLVLSRADGPPPGRRSRSGRARPGNSNHDTSCRPCRALPEARNY